MFLRPTFKYSIHAYIVLFYFIVIKGVAKNLAYIEPT